jgi:hypothetical protein
MLETVRAFASARLAETGEAGGTCEAVARWTVEQAGELGAQLEKPDRARERPGSTPSTRISARC